MRRGAARLLALLAVVLGLLGMHGLASTHHPVAATLGHALSAVAERPVMLLDRAGPRQHDHAASGALLHGASGASRLGEAAAGPAVPACEDNCRSGVALLCAAIIATAAAATAWLIAATSRRRVPAAPAYGDPRARAPGAARWLPPNLDPVAELCVSRT